MISISLQGAGIVTPSNANGQTAHYDMFGFDMLVHGICGDQLPTGGADADET